MNKQNAKTTHGYSNSSKTETDSLCHVLSLINCPSPKLRSPRLSPRPTLFLIYIDDLENCLSAPTLGSFADDTRLGKTISCCEDKHILQYDPNKVIDWSKKNNRQLHESKFELLTYWTPKTSFSNFLLSHLSFSSISFLQAKISARHTKTKT